VRDYQDYEQSAAYLQPMVSEGGLRDIRGERNAPFLSWEPPEAGRIVSPTDKEDGEENILKFLLRLERLFSKRAQSVFVL
jgi:hypothetical protein